MNEVIPLVVVGVIAAVGAVRQWINHWPCACAMCSDRPRIAPGLRRERQNR